MKPALSATIHDGRNVLSAINEAELLREALILEIRKLGALYCVGKRRPISELSPEKQVQVQDAYRDTHWSSDYGIELQGIFTSQGLAEKICKERGPNWFWCRLPIDSCLPDDTVFGEWAHVFPGSLIREMHENLEAATMAVPVSKMREMEEELAMYRQGVEDLLANIKELRRSHEEQER